jgi:hypothetical protein
MMIRQEGGKGLSNRLLFHQNDLSEFFAIVEFCNPGVLGSPSVFSRVFEQPIVQARQPGATKAEKHLGQERGASF